MPNYDTLEAAQARIIELEEANAELTNERDSLSQNNESLRNDNNSLRTLNQKYFNKLTAQYSKQEDENNDEDKEVQSCEEFAKSLKI